MLVILSIFSFFPPNRIDHLFPFRYDLCTIVTIHNRYVTSCISLSINFLRIAELPLAANRYSTLQRAASKFELWQDGNGGVDEEREKKKKKKRTSRSVHGCRQITLPRETKCPVRCALCMSYKHGIKREACLHLVSRQQPSSRSLRR